MPISAECNLCADAGSITSSRPIGAFIDSRQTAELDVAGLQGAEKLHLISLALAHLKLVHSGIDLNSGSYTELLYQYFEVGCWQRPT